MKDTFSTMMFNHQPTDQVIRRGLFSNIFLLRSASSRPLIVKIASHSRYSSRIIREYKIMSQLSHPTIAKTFQLDQSFDGKYFMVMDWCEGISAQRFVHRLGPPGTKNRDKSAIQILRNLCSALFEIHRKNFAHLDLKSDNVIVNSVGRATLLDFDSARPLSASRHGMPFHGTREYAAPERLKDQGFSAQADIYSLGALFYRLVSGRFYRSVTGISPEVHKRFPFLSIMLSQNPRDRPSALQLMQKLQLVS